VRADFQYTEEKTRAVYLELQLPLINQPKWSNVEIQVAGRYAEFEGRGSIIAGNATAAAFVDLDADSDLDIFVVNYIRWSLRVEHDCYIGGVLTYCPPSITTPRPRTCSTATMAMARAPKQVAGRD